MSKTSKEIDDQAWQAARWAVLGSKAGNSGYEATADEYRAMRKYSKSFTNGARWASDLP